MTSVADVKLTPVSTPDSGKGSSDLYSMVYYADAPAILSYKDLTVTVKATSRVILNKVNGRYVPRLFIDFRGTSLQ